MPTGKFWALAASDDISGPDVVCALRCFISFEVGIGIHFCHLFLLQAVSCGLTSFHAPWAVPSPMTRVWAGLLTCAINTFLPSGWYWGWSKRLIGTFSNSYGVLSGGMHAVLFYPILLYWPCMLHLSTSLSSHWCGCVCHSCIRRELLLSPSSICSNCQSNCRAWTCLGACCFMPLYWHEADDCSFVEVMAGFVLFGLPYCESPRSSQGLLRSVLLRHEVSWMTGHLFAFQPQNSSSKRESSWNIQDSPTWEKKSPVSKWRQWCS